MLKAQREATRKVEAIELENDIATSNLLQGKVESAKKAIQRATELKFADKRQELALEKEWLGRIDSKEARAREEKIKGEERDMKRLEDEANQVFDIAQRAAQAGAGASELAAINSATTREEAIRAASSLGRAARLDNAIKSAQLAEINAKVSELVGSGTLSQEQAENAENNVKNLDEILNPEDSFSVGLFTGAGMSSVMDSVVAPNKANLALTRKRFGKDGISAQQDYISKVENVLNTLTLNTFAEAKAKGMTFGAMSEGEWKILADSASALTSRRITKGSGDDKRVIGYRGTVDSFKNDLGDIQNGFKKAYSDATGTGYPEGVTVGDDGLIEVPDEQLDNTSYFNQ
jgi:hypothetical protein